MKKIKLFTLLLLLAAFNFYATAQNAGDNDPTFNPLDAGFGSGDGANSTVKATAIQSDGKIIIGGGFTLYNETTKKYIARLNIDGKLDTTFNIGTGFNDSVTAIAIQPDGKIIIGGFFNLYNGIFRNGIVRLNTDGSLDTSFIPGNGSNGLIRATSLQPDGKIIIVGDFVDYQAVSRNRIARINADGNLDWTFNPGTGANNTIYSTNIQPDGKIIISGIFTSYNGIGRNRIARLNTDGSLDTTFNIGTGANNTIYTSTLQPNGQLIIGGNFTFYKGIAIRRLARINADGSLDTTFTVGTGANNYIKTTSVQSDGKIIIGGGFISYNGISSNRVARINIDGSLDTTFIVGTGTNNGVETIAIQPNGQPLIGGFFDFYNGIARNGIVRLNADGSFDATFNSGTGANKYVFTIAVQTDKKIIIGGEFTSYFETAINRIARLNTDGSLDTTFVVGTGATGVYSSIHTITTQPDGKIIIGGNFTSYNGTPRNHIARLNTDGTLDTSFIVGTGVNTPVLTTAIQPDGKIIISGEFSSFNGIARNHIARLNTDGSIDNTFNPGTGTDNSVYSSTIQPDGKIIIGGSFTSFNGTTINKIARLNTDGSLDATFNSGTGLGTAVSTVVHTSAIQPDGKIIIGGYFTSFNGIAQRSIARLNTDGSLDATFNIGTGVDGALRTILIQPDGKLIIGGIFTSYNGITQNFITRLNTDGSLDATFNIGTGANSTVHTTTIQDDGNIIIGGGFTAYNGVGRNRVARILNCDVDANYTSLDNSNGNYSFTNTSTGNFNQTHWAFGDGTTSTTANPNHTFSANGTYVVALTVNDSTGSSSCMDYYLDTIVVTGVVAPLQCAAGFVMYPDAGGVTVVNSSTGTNLTYLWSFGDGDTSTLQFPTHTYAASGPYYLCLSIDDGAGCVDMYCDSIGENGVVFNKQTGFTINVIAPPLVTQVSEQAAITSAMSIYPNPTGKKLNVVFNKSEPYQLKIVTIDGKLIETKTIVGNITLDVSNYSSGMYFITATNNEGKVYQSKFVKE